MKNQEPQNAAFGFLRDNEQTVCEADKKEMAMNANKSWSNIGEEIRGAVEDALRTGNFRDLGDVVTGTVKDVSAKVGQAVSDGMNGTHNYTEEWEKATRERKRTQAENERKAKERKNAVGFCAPFVKIGSVSGTLYQVFGGIGTGIMAILSCVFLGLGIALGGGWWVTFIILVMLLLGFIGMINAGCSLKSRLKRARKYLELCGHNHYVNVENLALHTGKTKKFVLKDIKKMLKKGFFPEGHLDMQETCLMLDDKIYREYLELEKQRKIQEREQKEKEQLKVVEKPKQTAEDNGLAEVIAEGQDCIKRLREMNDNIPGEEISAKLFRLENLLKEIFEGLKEHPEQLPQMRKFMNYYLPTTLKLVSAYEEFDDMSAQGEEIMEAKAEIEKTLDSINSAFEELLNRMFRNTAFDVTADAQVLQTMLAKEGLTKQKEFVNVQ